MKRKKENNKMANVRANLSLIINYKWFRQIFKIQIFTVKKAKENTQSNLHCS